MNKIKFDFDDILLVPAEQTSINSRSEVDPFYNSESKKLPIFSAPMDMIVSNKNVETFIKEGISVCLPRGVDYHINNEHCFYSMSLDDFEQIFVLKNKILPNVLFKNTENGEKMYVLIDIANGHMKKMADVIKAAKETYHDQLIIMCGNIANSYTYKLLSDAGASYIRLGIGTGNFCLTSQNVAIGYPLASLIQECYKIKQTLVNSADIIADGGMKKYSDIIKALALGASSVMIGTQFNKCIESSGYNYFFGIEIPQKLAAFLFKYGCKIKKKMRGMSTKEVQKSWGKKQLTTSEGIVKKQIVEYTLPGWRENFTDYLKSSMSYCGAKTLDEFIGKVKYVHITESAQNRFKK